MPTFTGCAYFHDTGHAADFVAILAVVLTRHSHGEHEGMDLPQLGPVAVLLLKSRKSAAVPDGRGFPDTPPTL